MSKGEVYRKWEQEQTERINLRLNKKTDADIITALDGKQKLPEVKRLLRVGIAAERNNKL